MAESKTNDTGDSWEKISEELDKESAKTAFELGWGIVTRIGKKAWEEIQVRRALEKYAVKYNERHGQVKLFGAPVPIPLHQIYTEAQIVKPNFLSAFSNPEEMEKDFREGSRQHRAFRTGRTDAVEVANENQFLNLLGAPGAGKSTFLRKLGQKALIGRSADGRFAERLGGQSVYYHGKLPVLIELRRFKGELVDLQGMIANEFAICGFPKSSAFVAGALDEGGLLVLLDGLDEVPDWRLTQVIEHVRDFVDCYGQVGPYGNRFVTSCRTAHYKGFFSKFTDVVLADFSDEQIQQFARNRFRSEVDVTDRTADQFFAELSKPEHAGSLELARTPLLLGFLCVTYDSANEFPSTRAKLYQRALEILLREWSASKRVHDEPAYKELNTDLEIEMLAEMAAELFDQDRFFFSRDRAKRKIRTFMLENLNAPKSLDAEQILTAVEVHQGLIVKRASDSYSFSHLTIQEYLTARRIWESGEDNWRSCVENHFFQARWAVVFQLMAGFGRADDLLTTMANCCVREATCGDPQVPAILGWVHSNLEDSGRAPALESAETRLYLLTLGLSLAMVHAVTREIDRVTVLALAVALDRALALGTVLGLGFPIDIEGARDLVSQVERGFNLIRDLSFTRDRAHCLAHVLANGLVSGGDRYPRVKPAVAEPLRGVAELELKQFAQAIENLHAKLSLPRDMDGIAGLTRPLEGFALICRCKKGAFSLSATAWDQVCQKILAAAPR